MAAAPPLQPNLPKRLLFQNPTTKPDKKPKHTQIQRAQKKESEGEEMRWWVYKQE